MASGSCINEHFNAETFVQRLLEEGSKSPCDDRIKSFNENEKLPAFYDETLFKRGQKFFMDNVFALLLSKFLGLCAILAIPSIVRILIYTKMSGTPFTAYRRYLATVFHMVVWYRSDFAPGSKLWQSLAIVKQKHSSVSKKCCSIGLGSITQKDMALTQFGFMGLALAKREKIGLHNADDEDLRALVHVWRVIGFIIGIEDRFNICRDSVAETTAICRVLVEQVFKPVVERKEKDFIEMSTYLAKGMWAMNPTLDVKVHLNFLHRMLATSGNNNNNNNETSSREELLKMSFGQKIVFRLLIWVVWSLQFTVFRVYHNYTQYISFWLMEVFPFLAYYKYGRSNSHVQILPNDNKEN